MQNVVSDKKSQYIIKERWVSFIDSIFQISDKAGKILFLLKGRWNRHIFQDAAANEIFIIKHRGFFKWGDFEMYSHNKLYAIFEAVGWSWFSSIREFRVILPVERQEMIVKCQSESFFRDKYIFCRGHEDVAVLSEQRSFCIKKYFINIRHDQDNAFILAIAMMIIFAVGIRKSG